MNIDQHRYNALADWAESDKPEIRPENAQSGLESQEATRGNAAPRGRPAKR